MPSSIDDVENLEITFDKKTKVLLLKIDLSVKGVPSGTGKTTNLASTRGNLDLTQVDSSLVGMNLGLNLFKYPPREPKKAK